MCFPGRKNISLGIGVSQVKGTHITRDMCFPGVGTHITRDMWENIYH